MYKRKTPLGAADEIKLPSERPPLKEEATTPSGVFPTSRKPQTPEAVNVQQIKQLTRENINLI